MNMSIGFQDSLSGLHDWDAADRAERGRHAAECHAEQLLLAGSVSELMEWFTEDSKESLSLLDLVANAAETKATEEMKKEMKITLPDPYRGGNR
jgi:hypothetical protein